MATEDKQQVKSYIANNPIVETTVLYNHKERTSLDRKPHASKVARVVWRLWLPIID